MKTQTQLWLYYLVWLQVPIIFLRTLYILLSIISSAKFSQQYFINIVTLILAFSVIITCEFGLREVECERIALLWATLFWLATIPLCIIDIWSYMVV